MSSLVIVALPAEDDYVNKISSQQAAHMTLLYLGDDARKVSNLDQIVSFVDHAVNQMLNRFGLTVDRRGMLGENSADVLFFKPFGCCYDDINAFRAALLQNTDIRTAYDAAVQDDLAEGESSSEQQENEEQEDDEGEQDELGKQQWVPHLTLGYPDSPANPDDRDYPGIYYVNFDRVAVWDQSFAGTEFLLNTDDDYLMMSIGESFVNNLLHISGKPSDDYKEKDVVEALLECHGTETIAK